MEGLNPGLLHCRRILYQLSHKGSLQKERGRKFMKRDLFKFLSNVYKYNRQIDSNYWNFYANLKPVLKEPVF